MITARVASFVLVFVFSAPGFADNISAEKQRDIEKLLEMTGALAIGQQMSAAIVAQMTQVLRQARPDIPERMIAVLPDEVNAVIKENIPRFKEAIIPLYHKHFTESDIKGLIRFYSTDLGRKTIQVMPVLLNESMQVGQQWGRALGPTVEQRIKARFKKDGYEL